ncbi:hypothetical protein SFC66_14170 [Terribacillus saccharophilus]|uniref:hypothetical protein n=1 Tax=Terribacillus saccharophilus TaxID=361277 RepID=UPI003981DFC0
MTAISFYTVAILALILLLLTGIMTSVYFIFKSYNRKRQQAVMSEWQAARKLRE